MHNYDSSQSQGFLSCDSLVPFQTPQHHLQTPLSARPHLDQNHRTRVLNAVSLSSTWESVGLVAPLLTMSSLGVQHRRTCADIRFSMRGLLLLGAIARHPAPLIKVGQFHLLHYNATYDHPYFQKKKSLSVYNLEHFYLYQSIIFNIIHCSTLHFETL